MLWLNSQSQLRKLNSRTNPGLVSTFKQAGQLSYSNIKQWHQPCLRQLWLQIKDNTPQSSQSFQTSSLDKPAWREKRRKASCGRNKKQNTKVKRAHPQQIRAKVEYHKYNYHCCLFWLQQPSVHYSDFANTPFKLESYHVNMSNRNFTSSCKGEEGRRGLGEV